MMSRNKRIKLSCHSDFADEWWGPISDQKWNEWPFNKLGLAIQSTTNKGAYFADRDLERPFGYKLNKTNNNKQDARPSTAKRSTNYANIIAPTELEANRLEAIV